MPRFIIVSCASGYALDAVEADSPLDACRTSDNSGEFTYESIDPGEARSDDTLIVYGPTDLPVDDCTHPATIAAIDALPIAGYVRCSRAPR